MKFFHKLSIFQALFLFSIPFSHAESQDFTISAVYRVEFGGFDLGKFKFHSTIKNDSYSMKGTTRLRILKGAVMDWKMLIGSAGLYTKAGPQPATFNYSFRNKKKRKKTMQLEFANADQDMRVEPKLRKRSKKYVPLEKKHFENVYDPMSALMLLTHSSNGRFGREVCNQRIPLFDGKERYDIALKYKKIKMADIGEKKPKRAKSYVCSLRYIPIAGHKRKDKTKNYMAKVKGIEVWFSPLKEANMYLPHLIKIPTPFGTTTTIRTKSFKVERKNKQRLAYIR